MSWDQDAERLYAQAGFKPDEAVTPYALARALLGPTALRRAHSESLPGDAALVRLGGEWRIYLRGRVPEHRARFAVAHELAHWALGSDATESECDALAAAILVPRRVFLRLLSAHHRYPDLADALRTTESFAVLRYGEATGEPVALVAPTSVRVRGAEWAWPAEPELRRLAKSGSPGVCKVRLRDDPRRVAISPKISS